MREIAYQSPRSLKETVEILQSSKGQARLFAGGTDILVQLRERQRDADLLLDVKKVPELTEIRPLPSGGWSIGAAVPCARIEDHSAVAAAYPAVADAVHIIGGWQIKCRATLGGNLCTSSPAADSLPALIANRGVVRIAGPAGERRVDVEEFCTGPGRNILADGELVVSLELPPPVDHASGCYIRFIPRYEMDIAVVGAGTWLELDGSTVRSARIALGAVAPTPLLAEEASQWLSGKPATIESFAQAGDMARKVARPISDMRGTAEYRTHLVGVLVKRSLAIALRRARGEVVNSLSDGHF